MLARTPRSLALALTLGTACAPRMPTNQAGPGPAQPPPQPTDPPTTTPPSPPDDPPGPPAALHATVDADPFPCTGPVSSTICAGVATDASGDLVLARSIVDRQHLWIANDPEATVSKLDTRTGRELARYASVTRASLIDHAGGRPVAAWSASARVHQPSRLAVDLDGNVWVANRSPLTQPSITKIWHRTADCTDRDGDGAIDTSRDASGDGTIDVNDPAEFLGEADECIAMTVAIGAQSDYQARALAIEPDGSGRGPGSVWVGMYTEEAFYQINAVDGSLMQRVPATGTLSAALGTTVKPYGAAFDRAGRLWSIGGCCGPQTLISVDARTSPATLSHVAARSPGGAYGVTVDPRDRVWLGAYTGPQVFRYDPAANAWTTVTIPGSAGWITRGVSIDRRGNVWASMHGGASSRVARVNADAATVTPADVFDVGGNVAVAVAVDFAGDVWAINQATSNASRLHLDPGTGAPADHPGTADTTPVDTFPTGPNPYTYADFTGLGLYAMSRSRGEYAVTLSGCPDGRAAAWATVTWSATEPPGTRVELSVRAGDDPTTISQAPAFGPWLGSPAALGPGPVPSTRHLLLVFRLQADRALETPVLHGYRVDWTCSGAEPPAPP